jgi:hypothetical protein
MMNFTELASIPSEHPVPFTGQLRLAVAAYLARFKGSSRDHTESDLRSFLTWCAERGLDPLATRRPQLELYIRGMQEIRRFKPSRCRGASQSRRASAGPVSSMASWSTYPPSTSAAPRARLNHPLLGLPTCSSRPC